MANNTLLASDKFASGSLAAGWATCVVDAGGFSQIVAQQAEPSALSTFCGQVWTGTSFPNDHTSEITIGTGYVSEAVNITQLIVRNQSAVATCYQVQTSNGTATLYRTVAGSSTSLASASVTLAVGDVYSLQAAGSCLSLYRNGARILYFYDAQITGGAPGFGQYTVNSLGRNTVSAWRGYSAVQQDGVWQKQGIVIPGTTADLPYGSANPSNIIQEGNAQILSGTVYKMWYTRWSENSVGYAESIDGVVWTPRGTAVLTTAFCGGVIKNGSTYWMYIFTASGTGNCNAYSSSDGISWSLKASSIAAGTTYYFQPFTDGSGTYFVLARGHLYTSTDMMTWTDTGAASGISGVTAGGVTKVGTNWYCWSQQFPTFETPDGTEIVRFKCSNPGTFSTWTNDAHSQHISQLYEAVNTQKGQVVSGGLIQVGNQTYAYSTQSPGDVTTPAIYQIALSIAPTTLANLVAFPEDAMPQVATDPFTGGAGSLGANWTDGTTALKVVAGPFVEATVGNTACWDKYTGASFDSNQYSEVAVHNLVANGSIIAPHVREVPGFNWYEVIITGVTGGSATLQIRSRIGGAAANIGPSQSVTLTAEDKIRISVFNGSDGFPVLTVFQNGFSVLQVQDYLSTYTSGGIPGIYIDAVAALTDGQVSSWSGGNAATNSISGSLGAGGAGATVSYTGPSSNSVIADSNGFYYIQGLINGSYTITPTLSGKTFTPASSVQAVSSASVTNANFTTSGGSSYYSVPDCRVVKPNSATSETNQGTLIYDKQTSSNPAIPPTDSRVAGAPVDSRVNIPTNSRMPGLYGPGEN